MANVSGLRQARIVALGPVTGSATVSVMAGQGAGAGVVPGRSGDRQRVFVANNSANYLNGYLQRVLLQGDVSDAQLQALTQ